MGRGAVATPAAISRAAAAFNSDPAARNSRSSSASPA
jgi:hypothetical protein